MAPEPGAPASMLKSLRRIVQEVVSAPDLPETLAIIVKKKPEATGK